MTTMKGQHQAQTQYHTVEAVTSVVKASDWPLKDARGHMQQCIGGNVRRFGMYILHVHMCRDISDLTEGTEGAVVFSVARLLTAVQLALLNIRWCLTCCLHMFNYWGAAPQSASSPGGGVWHACGKSAVNTQGKTQCGLLPESSMVSEIMLNFAEQSSHWQLS